MVLAVETDKKGFDKKNDCTNNVGRNTSENKLNLVMMLQYCQEVGLQVLI